MTRITLNVAFAAGMLALFGSSASADLYSVAPSPNTVSLGLNNFIESVPQGSGLANPPNPVIGDNNIGSSNSLLSPTQHPGAFAVGGPQVGSYFIGVFGVSIDTSKDGSVYLWETTSSPFTSAVAGPQIQLGFWNGLDFKSSGNSVAASYLSTGQDVFVNGPSGAALYALNSSITHLSDFHISGNPIVNAVEISVTDQFAHNQVEAAAITGTAVPEPSTFVVAATAALVGLAIAWRRRKRVAA